MGLPDVKEMVEQFRRLDDQGRWAKLDLLLREKTNDPGRLDWRAKLVTALREVEVYPRKSYRGIA